MRAFLILVAGVVIGVLCHPHTSQLSFIMGALFGIAIAWVLGGGDPGEIIGAS